MKVSIIMAVFNGAETLQSALNSVFEQNYDNLELIIVDGASTDSSIDIIKKNNSKISYWISEPDKGIYDAWNKAIKVAHGDYICFIGCDDCFAYPNAIKDLVDCIGEPNTPPSIISANYRLIDKNGREILVRGDKYSWLAMKVRMAVAHPGMLHHKGLFNNGGYDTQYSIAADYELLLRQGPLKNINYLNRVTVLMGNEGVSNLRVYETLRQVRDIQLKHVSMSRGIFQYSIAILRTYLGNLKKRAWGK
jgi:glycosyltransferase involved in cell wall biosynthesis